jgi:hypothetical protein
MGGGVHKATYSPYSPRFLLKGTNMYRVVLHALLFASDTWANETDHPLQRTTSPSTGRLAAVGHPSASVATSAGERGAAVPDATATGWRTEVARAVALARAKRPQTHARGGRQLRPMEGARRRVVDVELAWLIWRLLAVTDLCQT